MKKYALYLVVILTVCASIYAYFNLLLPLDVFQWDESHHGFFAMQIFRDLQTGDWGSFWEHTNYQALWMPMHSWIVAVFLYIFGFGYTSARLSSLSLFFINSIILYLIGRELSEEKGWAIGLIAAICYLTSPTMLIFSVLNMQEMLGILMCLTIVYFMVKNIGLDKEWKFLIIGFLLSAAYWAKQNYAMVLAFGVGLYQLSLLWDIKKAAIAFGPGNENIMHSKQKPKKPKQNIKQPKGPNRPLVWLLDNIYILAGFLPFFLLWWITPPFERKYGLTVTFRQQAVAGGASLIPSFIGTLAFYVKSLLTSYSLSFWVASGCLASVIAALFFYHDKKIRLISLMFYANLLFICFMSIAQERFVSTAAPMIYILLGYFGLLLFDKTAHFPKIKIFTYVVISIFLSTFAYDLTCLTRYTRETANVSLLTPIYIRNLGSFSPPFLFGLAKRPTFTFPIEHDKKYPVAKLPYKSSLRDVLNFFRDNIEKTKSISTTISMNTLSPYVIYWHFYDWGAPVLSANDLAFNSRYFWAADYFLDLEVSTGSPYYEGPSENRWAVIEKALLKDGYIKLVASKEFDDLGVTAEIYKREKDILGQASH